MFTVGGKVKIPSTLRKLLTIFAAPSRRDDLEAVALMLIHLLTPRGLSWTRNGVPKNDTQHRRLKSEKKNAKPEDLCRGLPEEFEEFLRYTRGLSFTEGPNYKKWVERFRELAEDEGYTKIDDFIWPPPPIPKVMSISFDGTHR